MGRFLRLAGCAVGMAVLAVGATAFLQIGQAPSAKEMPLSEVSGKLDLGFSGKKDDAAPAAQSTLPAPEEAVKAAPESGPASQQRTLTVRPFSFDDKGEGHPVQFSADAEAVRSAAGSSAQDLLAPAAQSAPQAAEAAAKPAAPDREAAAKPAASKPETRKTVKMDEKLGPDSRNKKAGREEKKAAPAQAGAAAGREKAADRALADIRDQKDDSQPFDRVVTSARYVMEGSLIKLVLRGNSPMVGHFSQLRGPERVVLDLAGTWKIQLPKVPSNRLIQAVRIGHHADKTRLVFDLKTPGKAALVPLTRNSLELHIR